jgi:hypothetical protein
MANFAVRLVHGPGWEPPRQIRDQDGWVEQAAFTDGLADDGLIILGGPVGDRGADPARGKSGRDRLVHHRMNMGT